MIKLEELITEDVITVIVPFLSIDDRLKFMIINKTWHRAIRSLQNMWRNDVLIGFLNIDQIIGMENIISEYLKSNYSEDEIDWIKIVKFQYLKLPRKIEVERADLIKKLDVGNYGNVELVKEWKSPFIGQESSEVITFPSESSIFEFSYDIRNELDKLSDLESKKKRIEKIYLCCLVYELLSMGDYVPNLFTDIVKVIPQSSDYYVDLSNFELKVSFASILLAILDTDFGELLHKYFTNKFQTVIHPNSTIYAVQTSPRSSDRIVISDFYTPENVLEKGFEDFEICPNIPVTSWLRLSDLQSIGPLGFSDNLNSKWDSFDMVRLFSLYYNAGGGYYDLLDVSFSIDELDGRKVKLTRTESKEYY